MFLPQDGDLLPKTLDQLAPIETQLLIVVVLVLLFRHTHGIICSILGVPENWIVLLIKMMTKWF
jgi:hypothetical protein